VRTGHPLTAYNGRAGPAPQVPEEEYGAQGFASLHHIGAGRAASASCNVLSDLLADSIVLYDLYKRCQWLARGEMFHRLLVVLDQQALEQLRLVDLLIEADHGFGRRPVLRSRDVAAVTTLRDPLDAGDGLAAMFSSLLEAHEHIIKNCGDVLSRSSAGREAKRNDTLVEEILLREESLLAVLETNVIGTGVFRHGERAMICLPLERLDFGMADLPHYRPSQEKIARCM
jgi:starvation-inducible DNA-binding protein